MFNICIAQLYRTFRSPRIYIALIIGCVMQIVSIEPLAKYAEIVGAPLCAFEGFIYLNCDTYVLSGTVLAALIMVSDIPFSSGNELFPLLRTTRRRWLLGKCLYILIVCFLFYGIIFLIGEFYILNNVYFKNEWSKPFQILSNDINGGLYEHYRVYLPYVNISKLTPVRTFIDSIVLSVLYVFSVSLVIFSCNMVLKKGISFFLGLMFHILNYVMTAVLPTPFYKKISLLANSQIIYHNYEDHHTKIVYPSIRVSYVIYAIIITLLLFLLSNLVKRYDFKVSVEGNAD